LKKGGFFMGQRTSLYQHHLQAGAKMVDFGGWDMPIHYGSQINEHHEVRRAVGMFDVSHMTVIDVTGSQAQAWLQYLLPNDVARLREPGKALYSALLNEQGCVIDDLIVYRNDPGYRVIVNCATREKDLAWMRAQIGSYEVQLHERDDLAMIAVQGPKARVLVAEQLGSEAAGVIMALKPFQGQAWNEWFIARTGYTGEDGLEILLPADQAGGFWEQLRAAGVPPCGLGARDTLRLEAGMNLYGADMDESVTPLESNMAWTVAWEPAERAFIGRAALEAQRAEGAHRILTGLVLESRGVLRSHLRVLGDDGSEGEITSGSFSPTLGYSVALARVPASIGARAQVDLRGKRVDVRVVQPPFVRNGQKAFQ
jgi:aminomethyltransferase